MGRSDLSDMSHEPEGMQLPRANAHISGKSRPHILHMLCNTSGTIKLPEPASISTGLLYRNG